MGPRSFRIATALLALCAAAIVTFHVPKAAATSSRRWGAGYFPNVELTTQDGKQVKFYDDLLKGKVVVIDLIYTHCVDSCPLETALLAQVQRLLGDRVGKDIFFYSITIDPKRDTPEVLKAYAEKYHAGPGWLFLTGNNDDIDLISKKLGLYSDPDASNRDGHTPGLMIGNEPAGQWMANSAQDNPRFLATMIGDFMGGSKGHTVLAKNSYDQAKPLNMTKGQYLFATRCAACHTIGHGDKIGPDLIGVSGVRDHAWLTQFIQKPDEVLAANDPVATALFAKYKQVRMPNLHMGDEDVQNVIKFIDEQTAKSQPPAASAQNQEKKEISATPAGMKPQP